MNRVRGEADAELLGMKMRCLILGVGVIKTDLPLPLTGNNSAVYKIPGISTCVPPERTLCVVYSLICFCLFSLSQSRLLIPNSLVGWLPFTHAWSGLGNATVEFISNDAMKNQYLTAAGIKKFDD